MVRLIRSWLRARKLARRWRVAHGFRVEFSYYQATLLLEQNGVGHRRVSWIGDHTARVLADDRVLAAMWLRRAPDDLIKPTDCRTRRVFGGVA